MAYHVLMTSDCRVVCVDPQGQFCERYGTSLKAGEAVVYAIRRGDSWSFCIFRDNEGTDCQDGAAQNRKDVRDRQLWYQPGQDIWTTLFPSGDLRRDLADGHPVLSGGMSGQFFLHSNGRYFSEKEIGRPGFAESGGREKAVALRFVPRDAFSLFCRFASMRWACSPGGAICRLDFAGSTVENLKIGPVIIGMEPLLCALEQGLERGEIILNEGWKVWRFTRYNPLIILEAVGNEAMEELAAQLLSLTTLGQYQGTILVVTEQPEAECQRVVGSVMSGSADHIDIKIFPVNTRGPLTGLYARICLAADPDFLSAYGPVTFCGSGVVFDGNVDGFLGKAACLPFISSVKMFHRPDFDIAPPDLAPEIFGHVMIVPNYNDKSARIFEAACQCMELYIRHYTAWSLGNEPQIVFNHILQRLKYFSSYIGDEVMQTVLNGASINPISRIGLACFPREEGRYTKMLAYIERTDRVWG